jgi:hypothetical protein
MKKLVIAVAVLAAAGVASAAPIWEDGFDSLPLGQNLTSTFGATIGDGDTATGDYGIWYVPKFGISTDVDGIFNPNNDMTGNWVRLETPSNTAAARSAVIVLDGTGIAAGDYQLQFDWYHWAFSTAHVQVWDVQAGPTSNDYFNVKYAHGGLDGSTPTPVLISGTATESQIGYWSNVDNDAGFATGSGATLNFTYDGSGDIALAFGISQSQGNVKEAVYDNISLSVIPEPATMGLLGIGGLLMVYARRRKI